MNKIERVSRFFRGLFQIAFIWSLLSELTCWMIFPKTKTFSWQGFSYTVMAVPEAYAQKIMHTVTLSEKLLIFSIGLVPFLLKLGLIYFIIKLFKLYEKGEIFTLQNVKYIRKAGYALLLNELISPIYQFMVGIILTIKNPAGYRYASVTFTQYNVGMVLTALMIILISWIMVEACKLNEDQQLTI